MSIKTVIRYFCYAWFSPPPSAGITHLSMDVIWRGWPQRQLLHHHQHSTKFCKYFPRASEEWDYYDFTLKTHCYQTHNLRPKNQYSKSSIIFRSFIAWKIRRIDFWNKSDILRDLPHCATRTVASSEKFKSTQSLPGSLPSGFVSQKLPCSQTVTTTTKPVVATFFSRHFRTSDYFRIRKVLPKKILVGIRKTSLIFLTVFSSPAFSFFF